MKKLLSYLILSAIVFLNMGAGCSDKSEDPKPDEFASLLGTWKLESYVITRELLDGRSEKSSWSAKDKGVDVYWIFRSNGEFASSDGKKEDKGNWDLKVINGNSRIISKGTLSLVSDGALLAAAWITGTDKLIGDIYLDSENPKDTYFTITFKPEMSGDINNYFPNAKSVAIEYAYKKQ